MNMRLLAAVCVVLAVYLAFGDFISERWRSTPESFVSDVSRGIGGAIDGVTTRVTALIGI